MNAAQIPGIGDPETWGAVWHPNDPRMPDDDNDDGTLDLLAELRGWVDDAESAYEHGNDSKFLHCLRELIAAASQITDSKPE